MKKYRNLNFQILLGAILLLTLILDLLDYPSNQKIDLNPQIPPNQIKMAGSWSEPFIHITGANWTTTNSTKAWCSGAGTWSDPFILENITIDAGGSGSGIILENSTVFFTIINCTVFNSGSAEYDAGIKLINTCNGTLLKNNCSNNGGDGIILYPNCSNNTISENIVNDNIDNGIYLRNCNNITISRNDASRNDDHGIYLYLYCNNNTISENTVNNNWNIQSSGIYLEENCDNNIISGNNGSRNERYTILLENDCSNNTISGNNANDNQWSGIYLKYDCNNNTISGNNASFNDVWPGIYLDSRCNNNTISGNNASFNAQTGIYLWNDCDENTISENIACNNTWSGIHLDDYCDENMISRNNASYNGRNGIHLWDDCDENDIFNNEIFGNENGIKFEKICDNNTIIDNYLLHNRDYGVLIMNHTSGESQNNNIYGNLINNSIAIANGYDNGTNNQWDNETIGNYWEDYSGSDGDGNGFGDTPYDISGTANGKDNFPLMTWPFELSFFNPGPFSLSSPDAGTPDDDGQFTLNWSPSYGAENYTLYRGDVWFSTYNGSQTILVNEMNVLTYSEDNAVNGTYYYRVLAKNATGSIYSDSQSKLIEVNIPPLPPPGVFSLSSPNAGTPDEDGIFTLQWNISTDVQNYTLYMSLNIPFNTYDGSQTILINEQVLNSYTVTLNQNGTYYFRVCGRNSAGEQYSDLGTIAIMVIIVPEPPSEDVNMGDPSIPGYNLFFLIGILSLCIILLKKKIL